VLEHHPYLKRFARNWPTTAIMKTYLRYCRASQKNLKVAMAEAAEILGEAGSSNPFDNDSSNESSSGSDEDN
jgi:hypothetical protein